jgi:hypothetical protein
VTPSRPSTFPSPEQVVIFPALGCIRRTLSTERKWLERGVGIRLGQVRHSFGNVPEDFGNVRNRDYSDYRLWSHYTVGTRSTLCPPPEKYSSSETGRFHPYRWAYPVPYSMRFNANTLVILKRDTFGEFMSRNGLDFGSGLSVQEGHTFSMHSVRRTRLEVGQKVQILVILILA